MRSACHTLIALLLAAASATCGAAAVTFSFSGAVTSDPFGVSSTGAPISGSFTFDSGATDAVSGVQTGSFASIGPEFGFVATVDSNTFAVPGSVTVNVANNIGVDQYGVIGQSAGLTLELFMQDATASALASDALLLTPPSLGAFAFREVRLFGADAEFLGSIDALTCLSGCTPATPVPAPGSLLLGATALLALARSRARPTLRARS